MFQNGVGTAGAERKDSSLVEYGECSWGKKTKTKYYTSDYCLPISSILVSDGAHPDAQGNVSLRPTRRSFLVNVLLNVLLSSTGYPAVIMIILTSLTTITALGNVRDNGRSNERFKRVFEMPRWCDAANVNVQFLFY